MTVDYNRRLFIGSVTGLTIDFVWNGQPRPVMKP